MKTSNHPPLFAFPASSLSCLVSSEPCVKRIRRVSVSGRQQTETADAVTIRLAALPLSEESRKPDRKSGERL